MTVNSKRLAMARQALANAEAATGVRQAESGPREPTEREYQLRLFYELARRIPLGRRFSDCVDLGAWGVAVWRQIAPRVMTEADRERFAQVASDMWATLEQYDEQRATVGDGPLLLAAVEKAWRQFRRSA